MNKARLDVLFAAVMYLCAAVALVACQEDDGGRITSETHFLAQCSPDAPCEGGLTCACGACTELCTDSSSCETFGTDAVCTPRGARPLTQSCVEPEVTATCEVPCGGAPDCAGLGASFICDRGLCRQAGPACSSRALAVGDTALFGDLFLAASGEVTGQLEELLVSTGVLSTGQNLRDYSSETMTAFGAGQDLFSQYATALGEAPLRVAILNAGGADVLLDCDSTAEALCPSLQGAADGLESLLGTMVEDEIEHVVLFYYPRPDDVTLTQRFDRLEPEFARICAESALSCVFVPLAAHFESNRSDLLTGMGLLPTTAGAEVTAGLIYGALKSECLAP